MPREDFRAVYMPYCIDKMPDGKYVVLNRTYKPIGFITHDHIKYDEYPIAAEFVGLNESTAAKLSWNGSQDLSRIYLYNDGTNPLLNDENMTKYLDRLKILSKLKIKHSAQ